jgi:hypothetical protein
LIHPPPEDAKVGWLDALLLELPQFEFASVIVNEPFAAVKIVGYLR